MTRVAIIGGSMAGLAAGVALHHRGISVDIFERASEELAGRGAGIATHDELYAALAAAGVTLRAEMGVQSQGRRLLARDGSVRGSCALPQLMTSWGLMYRFLRAQFPDAHYHNGRVLESLAQTGDGVTAQFQDGTRLTADWLIGADGTRSTVRQQVAPEVPVHYCGYFGWRGLVDEARLPPAVHADLSHGMTLCLVPGGHWLGYLVAGPDDDLTPGRRWYNWGWYRTADAARLRDHLTDERGVHYAHGIPHPLIRPELVNAMRAEAQALLAPQCNAVIAATAQPFIQGMFDVGAPRLVHDRVCLVGDAAVTARPHLGLGVSKAVEDATTLAAALAAVSPAQALAAWERARLAYGHAALAFSRDLGSYIGPPPATPAQRALAEFHQRPEVLMAATAPTDAHRWLAFRGYV
jgi:2-polyprenyl-6-methoxyphenol hydroxylase-like FAD-dependent oxidoreductase